MKLLLLLIVFCTAELYADNSSWVRNRTHAEIVVDHINKGTFDDFFSSSTSKELRETLKMLKKGLSFARWERNANLFLGFGSREESRWIKAFKRKIKELEQKRSTFKRQRNCQKLFS